MAKPSQKRAITNFRTRLAEKGLVRFEVTGDGADRELVRSLARRLGEGGAEAERIRAEVSRSLGGEPSQKGGILRALMASPLVGAELDLARRREEGRKVEI